MSREIFLSFLINSTFFFWNSSKTRFRQGDLFALLEVFQIPQKITTCQGIAWCGMEALCILLKRLSFPWRLIEMVWAFGRSVPELCLILNHMIDFIPDIHGWWLQGFNRNHLTTDILRLYANMIHDKGSPLDNCFGLVDGTRVAISNPMRNQWIMSNGHKRIYAVKLQSGYGIVKWISSLHLRRSFPKTDGEDQRDFNTAMVKVRIQVGWFFGDINFFFFKFVDFTK